MSEIVEKTTTMSNADGKSSSGKTAGGRQQYINNMIIEESLSFLPAAVEYPDVAGFMAYLRDHLPQNSASTRLKYAEYMAYRYSMNGRMNLYLAKFLKFCPSDRARREVLWFETVRTMPALRELSESWLATLPESGVSRQQLLEFLAPRIGSRKPEKIATEAVGAIKKLGHLKSPKPGVYQAVWSDPPQETLVYVLSQLYPAPAVVRMEAFKADPLWQALLWPAATMEQLILDGERSGVVARVTKLDKYYQFALEGSGEDRLNQFFKQWRKE